MSAHLSEAARRMVEAIDNSAPGTPEFMRARQELVAALWGRPVSPIVIVQKRIVYRWPQFFVGLALGLMVGAVLGRMVAP